MARPQRCRRVCALPKSEGFAPSECSADTELVTMSVDEYEVIRLIDWVGLTQEQCATQIHVSRTTVTGIYITARHKLADALVHGKRLLIEGGPIKVCEHAGTCSHPCCQTGNATIKENDIHE